MRAVRTCKETLWNGSVAERPGRDSCNDYLAPSACLLDKWETWSLDQLSDGAGPLSEPGRNSGSSVRMWPGEKWIVRKKNFSSSWSLFWMPLRSVQWCRVALYSFVVKLQRALCVFPFFPRHIASSVFMCSGFLWCLIAHHKNILLVVHPCSFFPYVFNCSFLHGFHSYTWVIKIWW